jgi:hypothetical protein
MDQSNNLAQQAIFVSYLSKKARGTVRLFGNSPALSSIRIYDDFLDANLASPIHSTGFNDPPINQQLS